jgi:DNA end-binding protein Ku
MHNREYIVIIRARKSGLTLHTMFYSNEVREPKDVTVDKTEVKPQEEALAMQLIKNLAGPFKPEQYSDAYQEELQKLIEAKSCGKSITVPARRAAPAPIDLLAALKKSVERPAGAKEQKSAKTLMTVVPKPETKKKRQAG